MESTQQVWGDHQRTSLVILLQLFLLVQALGSLERSNRIAFLRSRCESCGLRAQTWMKEHHQLRTKRSDVEDKGMFKESWMWRGLSVRKQEWCFPSPIYTPSYNSGRETVDAVTLKSVIEATAEIFALNHSETQAKRSTYKSRRMELKLGQKISVHMQTIQERS